MREIERMKKMILTLSLMSICVSVFAAPLQVLKFKKSQLSQVEKKQICEQLQALCSKQAEWQSVITAQQDLWIISGEDIAQFQPSTTGFKLFKQWHIPLTPSDEIARSQQYIFPKLFPMDQNRYAIALIDTLSEMYSGGGAGIERASFYELMNSGQTHRFIENYPFSFYRMVRTCFSEQDDENAKGKCHDEDGLSLEIRPIKPMLWQFRYRYSVDVSPMSDSGERSYTGSRHLNIDLNNAPKQPNIPEAWNYAGQ